MKKVILTVSLATATAVLLFVGCAKKKDKDSSTPDYSTATEANSNQSDFDDMHKVVQDAMSNQGVLQGYRTSNTSSCSSITLYNSNSSDDDTITIDYGTTGCTGSDLRVRKGILIAIFSGYYVDQGTVVRILTQNYYVDGRKIDGQRKITNNGASSGDTTFTIVDTDVTGAAGTYAQITQTNGNVGKWRSTRTRTWTAGANTVSNWTDDILTVNGTADGVTSSGVSYSLTATNIELKLYCWSFDMFAPVSGTLSLVTSDGTRSLDYGDGTCDKSAVFTDKNGKTYTITIY